ncbi:MAG: carbon-phosphorus lyase complex subunit PhnI [Planctomycetes bacterium]|nr:carbon-phosphorus lyase complex subunit PhnI [Planctomycetota bacterium]
MGYVAIRGGEAAITEAARLLDVLRSAAGGEPLGVDAIRDQLGLLVDRVCGEGGCWEPRLAALAVKQSRGDPLEAAFLLRAWRSTRPRLGATAPHRGSELRLVRRISAAFKEVPGGQVLGPGSDYLQRLFRYDLLDESPEAFRSAARDWFAGAAPAEVPATLPKVLDALRAEGLLTPPRPPLEAYDVTREPLVFPVPRPAALAAMARGETGGLLAMAYSTMRGYGYLHPTVAELRYGFLPLRWPHPATGQEVEAGEVPVTECEIVAMHGQGDAEGEPPRFSLGYGCCLGHQEVKAIAMAMCDRSLQNGAERGAQHPAEDAEFVLMHIDGIESMGFCSHYKLPHYVTFQSDLDNLRKSRSKLAGGTDAASAALAEVGDGR